MITPEEFGEVERAGAVGELLGRFVDAQGRPVAASVNERAVAVRLEELPGRQTVAIAGGRDKARAIAAVLESGVISGLITDEATAHELTVLAGRPVSSIGLRSATTTTGRAGHV
jgi:DNA-binding transcriptional regulator LsrR (DeoR family)